MFIFQRIIIFNDLFVRLGKHKRLSFPYNNSQSTSTLTLIHVHLLEPYRTPNHGGSRYFLTIVDDYSRRIWTSLMQFKDQVLSLIQNFFTMISTQFKANKRVRSNNAYDFLKIECSSFFIYKGVIHESCCICTLQQTG